MDGKQNLGEFPQKSEEPLQQWESLIAIKTGGSKNPVFLIHGGGLNMRSFDSVIKHFTEDQPVYGIQALGLSRQTTILPTIEGISEKHIQEILKVHPQGPYSLAGYSLGGFIAFEIAKQLKEMGKEVKMLGIIDTNANDLKKIESFTRKPLGTVKRQLKKILPIAQTFFKFPKDTLRYHFKRITDIVNALTSVEKKPDEKKVLSENEKKVYDFYTKALNDYVLVPGAVMVTLFSVEKRIYYIEDHIYLGWKEFALEGVEIQKIPGDHRTCMYPPFDKAFVEILQKSLDSK